MRGDAPSRPLRAHRPRDVAACADSIRRFGTSSCCAVFSLRCAGYSWATIGLRQLDFPLSHHLPFPLTLYTSPITTLEAFSHSTARTELLLITGIAKHGGQ